MRNCLFSRDSGPSVATLTSRLTMQSVVGCFGCLDRCATLAYELCWTCDCLEPPRPSAADSRRQCPFSCAGIMLVPLTSACVLLPVLREVEFATSCLRCATFRVWHIGYRALASSPCGTGHIGRHRQGHLSWALGLGWSTHYRTRLPRHFVPC